MRGRVDPQVHEAQEAGTPAVEIWGTGLPRREFLHVDHLANACLSLMQHYEASEPLNVRVGRDIRVRTSPS